MSHFEKWRQEKSLKDPTIKSLQDSTIKRYRGAINGVLTQWAVENGIISGSLADVTNVAEFSSISKCITNLPIFKKRDKTGNRMYSSALEQYLGYLRYLTNLSSNVIERDIDDIIESNKIDVTEKVTLIKARIGQGDFRSKLINYWQACSVSGFPEVNLLVASHIKPWAVSNDKERRDVYNGLLLLPNLDKAFDLGYITFDKFGKIVISNAFDNHKKAGISEEMKVVLKTEHQKYMEYHREHVFKKK